MVGTDCLPGEPIFVDLALQVPSANVGRDAPIEQIGFVNAVLSQLFQVLNTAESHRSKHIDEQLGKFAYINGKLFEETLPMADFSTAMREALHEQRSGHGHGYTDSNVHVSMLSGAAKSQHQRA